MKKIYITTLFVFIAAITFGQQSIVNTVEAIINEKVVLTLKGYVGNIQWQSSSDQNIWADSTNCTADTLQIITKRLRYYRAKITAGNCPPYYSDITLIKPTQKVPTITTNGISNITYYSATSGGNITNDGGSIVTARGVCYSTGQTPTLADSLTIDGVGVGSFASAVTSISHSTKYYVRAYATNSVGTAYGEILPFTSLGVESFIGCEQAYPNTCGDTVIAYFDGELIKCLKINGEYIYQGDIVIEPQTKGAAIESKVKRWPDNEVYYTINTSFRKPERVIDAIKEYENRTNLTFIERTNQTNYIEFVYDMVGCASRVGMQGGKQRIRIADWGEVRAVIHEIGHAICLKHEQCKAGRDNYVTVIEENIEEGKENNFDEYKKSINTPDFDFNSIMLYDSYAFSIERGVKPTIVKKDGTTFNADAKKLSDSDISIINIIYPKFYVSTSGDDNNPGSKKLPFKTIQVALNKIANFSTTTDTAIIYVEQGTYLPGNGLNTSESGILINTSNVKILGGWDSKFKTQVGYSTLNGANSLNVIKANNVSSINIDKFEITNGISFSGGGVDFYNVSNSKITNSTITNNTAENKGGGICIIFGTNNLVYNSVVSGNMVTDTSGGRGGGICIENSANNIINATINGNTCNCEGGGLAICGGNDNKVSESSIIENNIANGGGGISLWESNNNMIYGTINSNNSGDWGGGVHLYKSSFNTINATVTNNKGIGNTNWNYMHGGGIGLHDNCNNNKIYGTISNNVLTDNDGTGYYNGAGIDIWDSNYNEINAEITNNYFSVSGSSSSGGGICIAGDYNIVLGKIIGNSATLGGGINFHVTEFHGRNNTIEAEISGNSASFGGGACVMMGSNYTSNIIIELSDNIATGTFSVECTQENGRWSGDNNNILYLSWDLQCP